MVSGYIDQRKKWFVNALQNALLTDQLYNNTAHLQSWQGVSSTVHLQFTNNYLRFP